MKDAADLATEIALQIIQWEEEVKRDPDSQAAFFARNNLAMLVAQGVYSRKDFLALPRVRE